MILLKLYSKSQKDICKMNISYIKILHWYLGRGEEIAVWCLLYKHYCIHSTNLLLHCMNRNQQSLLGMIKLEKKKTWTNARKIPTISKWISYLPRKCLSVMLTDLFFQLQKQRSENCEVSSKLQIQKGQPQQEDLVLQVHSARCRIWSSPVNYLTGEHVGEALRQLMGQRPTEDDLDFSATHEVCEGVIKYPAHRLSHSCN